MKIALNLLILLAIFRNHDCQKCVAPDLVPDSVWNRIPTLAKYRPAPADEKPKLLNGQTYNISCPTNEFLVHNPCSGQTYILVDKTMTAYRSVYGYEERATSLYTISVSCMKADDKGQLFTKTRIGCSSTLAYNQNEWIVDMLMLEGGCFDKVEIHLTELAGDTTLLSTHTGKKLTCDDGWKLDGASISRSASSRFVFFCLPETTCALPPPPTSNVFVEQPALARNRLTPVHEIPRIGTFMPISIETPWDDYRVMLDCAPNQLVAYSSMTRSLVSALHPIYCNETSARWESWALQPLPNDAQMFCANTSSWAINPPYPSECMALFHYPVPGTDELVLLATLVFDYGCRTGEQVQITILSQEANSTLTGKRVTCQGGLKLDGKLIAPESENQQFAVINCETEPPKKCATGEADGALWNVTRTEASGNNTYTRECKVDANGAGVAKTINCVSKQGATLEFRDAPYYEHFNTTCNRTATCRKINETDALLADKIACLTPYLVYDIVHITTGSNLTFNRNFFKIVEEIFEPQTTSSGRTVSHFVKLALTECKRSSEVDIYNIKFNPDKCPVQIVNGKETNEYLTITREKHPNDNFIYTAWTFNPSKRPT